MANASATCLADAGLERWIPNETLFRGDNHAFDIEKISLSPKRPGYRGGLSGSSPSILSTKEMRLKRFGDIRLT